MRTGLRQHLDPGNDGDLTYIESLIREDYARCHPGETLDDLKRRASFSREDRGLLRDWMAVAAARGAKPSPPRSTTLSEASTVEGPIEGSEPQYDPGSTQRATE